MSTNLVIVAIPAADDRIWKISSEKIPHMTLLFLGDAENNPNVARIMQFVWHAVNISEHGPFMLDVDRRDILGEDEADVLHFRKDWSFKWIEQFRSQLLKNTDIRTAYDSTDQFPDWQPHLTLGYPETPAKENDDEHGINWVSFDRIAVWTGNYEGPQFRLEWPDRGLTEVMMSSMNEARVSAGLEALEHFGVKGMKWGQRKAEIKKGWQEQGRRNADAQFERDTKSVFTTLEVMSKASKPHKADIAAINAKPEYAGGVKRGHPLRKQYKQEMADAYTKRLQEAADSMTNASGDRKYSVKVDGKNWRIQATNVVHADDDLVVTEIWNDDDSLIVGISVPEPIQQTVDLGAEFLEHYGIKGMKWGVRNKRPLPTPVEPKATSVVPRGAKKKTKIETEGGENHDASPDAIKVAQAKAKLQKSGPAALSNQELREVANRLQLETQVKQLTTPASKRFVSNILRTQGSQSINRFASKKLQEKVA